MTQLRGLELRLTEFWKDGQACTGRGNLWQTLRIDDTSASPNDPSSSTSSPSTVREAPQSVDLSITEQSKAAKLTL
jgi:hypothetical protein